jgi:hypothetical protein
MKIKKKLKKIIQDSDIEEVSKYLWDIFLEKMSEEDAEIYDKYLAQYPQDLPLITEIIEKKLWAFFTQNREYVKSVIDFEVETLRRIVD